MEPGSAGLVSPFADTAVYRLASCLRRRSIPTREPVTSLVGGCTSRLRRAWNASASTTSSCCTCTTLNESPSTKPPHRVVRSTRSSTSKRQGLVDHLGVAGGPVGLLQRYLDTGVFDVILTHNRYSLLDQSAEGLFMAAHQHGLGVLNAAPYGGGMLAKGPDVQTKYAYGQRSDAIGAAAAAMQSACGAVGVPLAAAALQFSLRAPFIDSTVVGVSSPERIRQTIDLSNVPIPESLWAELEALRPDAQLWLDPAGTGR